MLQGKTAVITGGVRGIGKCIAETFCKNGANVIICDISSPEAAAKTEEELKAYGTRVRMYNGDITDPQTAENIAQIIKDEFDKKVDILVNNAGITNDKLMIKMKPEEFTESDRCKPQWCILYDESYFCADDQTEKRIHHQHVFRIRT